MAGGTGAKFVGKLGVNAHSPCTMWKRKMEHSGRCTDEPAKAPNELWKKWGT